MYALQGTDVGAKNLVSYICPGDKEMRTLLVMGSVLPDWLFRFLVYPIYKGNLKRAGGFWISSQNTAQELTAFLKRNGYRFPDKKKVYQMSCIKSLIVVWLIGRTKILNNIEFLFLTSEMQTIKDSLGL